SRCGPHLFSRCALRSGFGRPVCVRHDLAHSGCGRCAAVTASARKLQSTLENGMDLWKLFTQGWPVITAAPFIVLGLMAAAAGTAWRTRGSLDKGTISGLTAQVGALK